MSRFPWGKIINRHEIIIGEHSFEVIEYLEHITKNGRPTGEYEETPMFHIDELSTSWETLNQAAIGVIVYLTQGINSHDLALGISRMLEA